MNEVVISKNNIPVIYTPLVIYLVINVYFINSYIYIRTLSDNLKFIGRSELFGPVSQ